MDFRPYAYKRADEEVEDNDDFMQYYRKFRPSLSSSASFQGSSRTSSSSPNIGQLSDRMQRLKKQWWNPKRKLLTKQSRSTEEATNTSPLQGLSGMLSDKMTFSQNNVTVAGEDLQSRDSGNSSGGSPDLRCKGVQQPTHDWYQRGFKPQQQYDDDARSYMADPADLVLESARHSSRPTGGSVYSFGGDQSSSSKYYDSFSQSSRLVAWCPDNVVVKRKLDCLKEDPLFSMSASPRRKRPQHHREEEYPYAYKENTKVATSLISAVCSRLWQFIKTVMTVSSTLLVVFALLFMWRSYKCENFRQTPFDLRGLGETLENSLYGQHVARQEIMRSLKEFTAAENYSGELPVLVLLLAGQEGSGKTFTSGLIRDHFPVRDNVHSFSVPLHFAHNTDNFYFLDELSLHISRSCGYSLVLFDDMDSASDQAQEKIARFVVALKNSQLASRSNGTLVVMSTNAGGRVINQHVVREMKTGGTSSRDTLSKESLLELLVEEGVKIPCVGHLRRNEVTSVIVPFLPLTREHIRECITREISTQGFPVLNREVESILGEVVFLPQDFPVLAKSGCKQIAGKVDMFFGAQDPYLQH